MNHLIMKRYRTSINMWHPCQYFAVLALKFYKQNDITDSQMHVHGGTQSNVVVAIINCCH
jgi:hypothetical protein